MNDLSIEELNNKILYICSGYLRKVGGEYIVHVVVLVKLIAMYSQNFWRIHYNKYNNGYVILDKIYHKQNGNPPNPINYTLQIHSKMWRKMFVGTINMDNKLNDRITKKKYQFTGFIINEKQKIKDIKYNVGRVSNWRKCNTLIDIIQLRFRNGEYFEETEEYLEIGPEYKYRFNRINEYLEIDTLMKNQTRPRDLFLVIKFGSNCEHYTEFSFEINK